MLALVAVAPIVAAGAFACWAPTWPTVRLAAIAAGLSAILIGWPVLFWLLDQGRTALRAFVIAGALIGAVPMTAALVSGVLGLFLRSGDLHLVRRAIDYGAPIPWYGVQRWSDFAWFEALSVLSGVVTLLTHRALVSRKRPQA